jgi:hypothetical protein
MKLALCIRGQGPLLKEGKVYEIANTYFCGYLTYDVPAANSHSGMTCPKCGRSAETGWMASRFIPINDADVKDDVQQNEDIREPA